MTMGLRGDDAEEGQYACEEEEGVGDNDTKQPYKGFGGSFALGTSRKHIRTIFGSVFGSFGRFSSLDGD